MTRADFLNPISPLLVVLHSNRMEQLRDGLVGWLNGNPLDPLENDIIAVQSNGIAQWLRRSLAQSDTGHGIAAAIETPMPSRLMWTLYRRVLGAAAVPESSPLDEGALAWRLMRLLGSGLAERPVYAPLRRFLQDDPDLRKRHQLAIRLADLFDQYQVYRADWLADWAAGRDVLRGGAGVVRELEPEQQWQAALWRDILADVGEAAGTSGRAAVHARFLQALREWPQDGARPDLPRRIVVFGVSSLPRQTLEALMETARWTQVLVCVHNPCEFHWADIVEGRALLRSVRRHQQRKPGSPLEIDPEQLHEHAHPLLASWGRQGRDYIALLEELEQETMGAGDGERQVNVVQAFVPVDPSSMLGQLQDDIRMLRALPEILSEGRRRQPRDFSIRFHVAHGPLREVEILHDQLLAAFDADPSLQPDDVIVMVPDIERYAPHIEAVFGLHGPDDPRRIPHFIVDRGPAQVNTVADAVERLLAAPVSRLGVGDLLDLLDIVAVRQRLGLHEEDLAVLRDWIQRANVRWGLDAGHRAALGVDMPPDLAEMHTWMFGLRRMLAGYALGDAEEWNGIAPFGDVAGLEARLVGTLAHVLDRLMHHCRVLVTPATPSEWAHRLRELLADFLAEPDDVAGYTIEQLHQALDDWLQECEASGFDEPLTLQVVGKHWLACLQSSGMAQRFVSGAVTFATLMPMRAIPFRYVCLMGMNDADYPRSRPTVHFDLMEKDYRPGDRSRRDDDRYLFLEALLSARECFYVSWVGRSIVDNSERPPSVLISQLRDHLAAGWRDHDGADVLAALTTTHPLQAFSVEYFRDASVQARLFTYEREWRSADPAPGATPIVSRLDAPEREEPLSFRELGQFLQHPAREFFRQRLQVRFEGGDSVNEEETFVADGLDKWGMYDRLLRAARSAAESGAEVAAACDAVLARMRREGELALGGAGVVQADRGRETVQGMMDDYIKLLGQWPEAAESMEIRHACDGTPGLAGWLHGLRRNGEGELVKLDLVASNLIKDRSWRPENLLPYWVQHLAANAAGASMETRVVSPAGQAQFLPMDQGEAASVLDTLLFAWVEGMCRPLPVKASFAVPIRNVVPPLTSVSGEPGEWQALLRSEELLEALQELADGGWNAGGRDSAYEARAYPTADALLADGELVRWALQLYWPMLHAVREQETE